MERRDARYAVAFAAVGAGLVLFWHLAGGEYGTQGGYVAHPAIRLAVLIAWGTAVGAAVGWLAAALPSRAAVPLGIGAILGLVGFILAVAYEIDGPGGALIDGSQNLHVLWGLIGAGIGWTLGALIGFAGTTDAPATTQRQKWLLRSMAVAVVFLGAAATRAEPYFATTRHPEQLHLPAARISMLAVASLIALTMLIAARRGSADERRAAPSEPTSRIGWLPRTGIILGCTLLIVIIAIVPQSNEVARTQRDRIINARAASRLEQVAARVADRYGTYPSDLSALLAAGGRVPDGSVARVRWVGRRYCVVVGRDDGNGSAEDPLEFAVLIPDVPGPDLSVSMIGGTGDRCARAARADDVDT